MRSIRVGGASSDDFSSEFLLYAVDLVGDISYNSRVNTFRKGDKNETQSTFRAAYYG